MRIFFLVFLFVFALCANDELNKDLKENERIQKQLNKKLEELAQDIVKGEQNLKQIASQIQSLSTKSTELKATVDKQSKELDTLNLQNQSLLKDKNEMENKLISLIAKDFSLDLAIPSGYLESEESLIIFEVLNNLDLVLKDEFYKLSKDYEQISKLISQKQGQIDKINANLNNYKEQLSSLESLKQRQINEIKEQKSNRVIYNKRLSDLQKRQEELRKTLEDLQITSKPPAKANQNVRQLGSSYQGSKVKKYSGRKTIAPLDSFTVKQKFGNFIDPIYNIKLFNENVILKSNTKNATVKSVLAGKIVFAKETNLLQKVVIVEHSNSLHTIYAHLDKISPTIKTGKNVKKGEVLGRVKDDLSFEVTQEKFHINPLELISLN
ncbi:murein hydrolase activator EnvC family protein [Campylobacter avium]|uniref:murein hydrolase activator EnvC family protein n=1 Tax=Campylobacter avium TaxID=522485 RepID=UPI00255B8584|nr:peptidoglycan DD-metalloendopeptidase family protein [Campylobacter avium]